MGAVPAIFALYFRLTIPESPRFTIDVTADYIQAAEDSQTILMMNHVRQTNTSEQHILDDEKTRNDPSIHGHPPTFREFRYYFGQWKNLKVLLGCSLSWFALDVAFYGINLNQSVVLQAIGYAPTNAPAYDTLMSLASGNLMIALMGAGLSVEKVDLMLFQFLAIGSPYF